MQTEKRTYTYFRIESFDTDYISSRDLECRFHSRVTFDYACSVARTYRSIFNKGIRVCVSSDIRVLDDHTSADYFAIEFDHVYTLSFYGHIGTEPIRFDIPVEQINTYFDL